MIPEDLFPALKALERLNKRVTDSLPNFRLSPEILETANRFNEIAKPLADQMKVIEEVTNSIPAIVPEFFRNIPPLPDSFIDILKRLEELENTESTDFHLLSQNGWFPDFSSISIGATFQQVQNYRLSYDNEGHEKADLEITEHFESVMDRFLDEGEAALHEGRGKLIKDAIHAHKNGLYSLSSPMFLIQADGHAAHAYDAPVWGPSKKKMLKIAQSEYESDKFLGEALLPFFRQDQPMMASEKQRRETPPPEHIINRHMVLHGESLNYDTRENSARAFSFLWYCMFFMDCFFEERGEAQDREG
ncbi:MAG: hypothetical protein GYB54_02765 [Gammaproteobacteria bacterium]|nr:hypothetical protein [Gammaproteobacteria bacterium]